MVSQNFLRDILAPGAPTSWDSVGCTTVQNRPSLVVTCMDKIHFAKRFVDVSLGRMRSALATWRIASFSSCVTLGMNVLTKFRIAKQLRVGRSISAM
jgi:hypothetical protein